jgi:hypothetical protein
MIATGPQSNVTGRSSAGSVAHTPVSSAASSAGKIRSATREKRNSASAPIRITGALTLVSETPNQWKIGA